MTAKTFMSFAASRLVNRDTVSANARGLILVVIAGWPFVVASLVIAQPSLAGFMQNVAVGEHRQPGGAANPLRPWSLICVMSWRYLHVAIWQEGWPGLR
jgi:hypothetical protein